MSVSVSVTLPPIKKTNSGCETGSDLLKSIVILVYTINYSCLPAQWSATESQKPKRGDLKS